MPSIALLLVLVVIAAFAPARSRAQAPVASRRLPRIPAPSAPPAAQAPDADTLVVQGLGKASVALGGKWEFKTGDDMAWASPAFDDSAWEKIAIDRHWGVQGHYAYTGFAWYRRHIDFVPVPGGATQMSLFMGEMGDAYEVYWNGALIGRYGKLPPHQVVYSEMGSQLFGLGTPGSGVLAIRIWTRPLSPRATGEGGGLSVPPVVGSTEAIADHKGAANYGLLRGSQFDLDLGLLEEAIALLGLLVWLRDRRQRLVLWMVFYLFPLPIDAYLHVLRLPIPANVVDILEASASILGVVSVWFILLYLFRLEDDPVLFRWIRNAALVWTLCMALSAANAALPWVALHFLAGQILGTLDEAAYVALNLFALGAIVLKAARRRRLADWSPLAVVRVAGTLFYIVANAAALGLRYTHWKLADTMFATLFTIRGNAFTANEIFDTLFLIAIVYGVYHYSVEQNARQGALEQEFKSAQELQRILIPETLPPLAGYAVTSAYIPAQQVGGDFFQLIALAEGPDGEGSTLLVLGDVSGKGLKAAMTVSLIVGAVRTLVEASSDPAVVLTGLNRRLEGRLRNGFVTCLVLRLEPDGACAIANAGHLSPFLNDCELELPPELPLGIVRDVAYETTTVRLGIGDRLTLYTDGLLEARNHSGELYGFERVRELIATRPDAHAASEIAVAFGQDDDITVLTVTRLALGVESTTHLVAPELVSAV
ncbi:MAG: SpoIIE family protein phosphatase [Acidobacteriaceae bacterium]